MFTTAKPNNMTKATAINIAVKRGRVLAGREDSF